MLKINKKVEYSLMALKMISAKPEGELTSAREICKKVGTPFDTTSKVLQTLNQEKIVNSVKGMNGGYYLTKDLNDLTFVQLSKMIKGKERISFCISQESTCNLYSTCNIKDPIESLNYKVNNFLEKLSIQEILENKSE